MLKFMREDIEPTETIIYNRTTYFSHNKGSKYFILGTSSQLLKKIIIKLYFSEK